MHNATWNARWRGTSSYYINYLQYNMIKTKCRNSVTVLIDIIALIDTNKNNCCTSNEISDHCFQEFDMII